jgi:poly(A) polymerase
LSDNVYGSQAEDAARRDFTINALYFDPESETILDYVGGVPDIRARRLKLIGPPVTRFREDPVRMLRAVRLAAKLGLAIDRKTEEPIQRLAPLMQNVPPARLFEEMQKLLLSGHAVDTLKSLRAHGLSHGLLPLLDVILEQPLGQKFIDAALVVTDERVRTDKGVSPAFLFAALLWHEVLGTWNAAKERGERPLQALFDAMDHVLSAQAERIAIPRRFEATIKEIWSLQPRFEQRAGSRPMRLLEHPRFRAAYDFLALRGESGEVARELVDWWTRFQTATDDERQAMLKPDEAPKKRRRPRSRRKRAEPAAEAAPPSAEE